MKTVREKELEEIVITLRDTIEDLLQINKEYRDKYECDSHSDSTPTHSWYRLNSNKGN